jgi:hypothetical protein
MTEKPDWIHHLPPEARAAMDAELAGLDGDELLAAVAAWRSTALAYADPELLAALTRVDDAKADPIEVEVSPEQRARYEVAAAERGQILEAFVIDALDAAVGDRSSSDPTGSLRRWADVRPRVVTSEQRVARYRTELDTEAAEDRQARIKAGFAVARALGVHENHEALQRLGHADGQYIVVALPWDAVGDVHARAEKYTPAAIIATYWPETDKLTFGRHVAARPVYRVTCMAWGHGLELHVDGVGVTQSHSLDDADAMARAYIAGLLDIAPDSFDLAITDPETTAAVQRGFAEAERGETVDLGSFEQYLDLEG